MKLIYTFAFLLLAGGAAAQEVTLSSPVQPPSETKYVVRAIQLDATNASIDIEVQSSGSATLRAFTVIVPDASKSSTMAGLAGAMITARATETGTDKRKLNFRIIGYLFDRGYFPASSIAP